MSFETQLARSRISLYIAIAFSLVVPLVLIVIWSTEILVPWPVGGTVPFDVWILAIPFFGIGIVAIYLSYRYYRKMQERTSIERHRKDMHASYWRVEEKRGRFRD